MYGETPSVYLLHPGMYGIPSYVTPLSRVPIATVTSQRLINNFNRQTIREAALKFYISILHILIGFSPTRTTPFFTMYLNILL